MFSEDAISRILALYFNVMQLFNILFPISLSVISIWVTYSFMNWGRTGHSLQCKVAFPNCRLWLYCSTSGSVWLIKNFLCVGKESWLHMDGEIHQADHRRFVSQDCLTQLKSRRLPQGWAVTRYHGLRQMCGSIRWCASKLNFFNKGKTEFFHHVPLILAGWRLMSLSLVGIISDHENGVIVIWLTQ